MSTLLQYSGNTALDITVPLDETSEYFRGALFKILEVGLHLNEAPTQSAEFMVKRIGTATEILQRKDMQDVMDLAWYPGMDTPRLAATESVRFTYENPDLLEWFLQFRYSLYYDVADWQQLLLPKFPNMNDSQIQTAIISAAREFCAATKLWVERYSGLSFIAGQAEYALPLICGLPGEIVSCSMVWVGSRVIDPISIDNLTVKNPEWINATGTPTHYLMGSNTDVIRFYPTPNVNQTFAWAISLIFQPIRTATEVPLFLFRKYDRTITDGARASLFKERDREGDLREATIFGEWFNNGIGAGAANQLSGSTTASKGIERIRRL